ncbi:hypothetical protein Bca101_057910 [Brassica carinata]
MSREASLSVTSLCTPPHISPHRRFQTSSPPQLAGDGSSSASTLHLVFVGNSFAYRQKCHGGS